MRSCRYLRQGSWTTYQSGRSKRPQDLVEAARDRPGQRRATRYTGFPPQSRTLLRDHPHQWDPVALCTPPQVRRVQAAAALAAGKHVMLEKPPGASVRELDPLIVSAARADRTLFATWHSRFAPAVEPARRWLDFVTSHQFRRGQLERGRPRLASRTGLDLGAGGLGVFDPGINALSILTCILPRPPFVTAAELDFPANRAAPIAARLSLTDDAGLPITAEFDFRQTGPQSWDIVAPDRSRTADPFGRRAPGCERGGPRRCDGNGISRALPSVRRIDRFGRQRCRPDAAPTCGRCLHARPAAHRRALRGLIMVAASHLAREMFGRLPDGRAVERVTLRGMHGFKPASSPMVRRFRRWSSRTRRDDPRTWFSDMAISPAILACGSSSARPSAVMPIARQCPLCARRRGGLARGE